MIKQTKARAVHTAMMMVALEKPYRGISKAILGAIRFVYDIPLLLPSEKNGLLDVLRGGVLSCCVFYVQCIHELHGYDNPL